MRHGLQIQEFSTDTESTVTVIKRAWSYLVSRKYVSILQMK